MTTLEWVNTNPQIADLGYALILRHRRTHFIRTLGYLSRLDRGDDWDVSMTVDPRHPETPSQLIATLPASLSLEDAQRAAKLLLMVGDQ